MNTAILYSKEQDITTKVFCGKLRAVSQLLCDNGSLALVCFDKSENFQKIFKRTVNENDIIFITKTLFEEFKSSLPSKLTNDNFLFYRGSRIAVLPEVDNEFYKLISSIICSCHKSNKSFSSDYLDISEISTNSVIKLLQTECLFSNPRLFVINEENYTRVLILAEEKTQKAADTLCFETLQNLKMLFGDNAFTNNFEDIATTVIEMLKKSKLKVATAESCTAGLLSSAITSVPGSSDVFEIGISSYADRIKNAALGVSASTLKNYGAVSMQTAVEMARGIKLLGDADIGIAATGVAGPGASERKPVGTVFIALTDGVKNWVIDLNLSSNLSRDEIRQKTTFACLDLLRRYLQYFPNTLPCGTNVNEPLFVLYEQPHFEPSSNKAIPLEEEIIDCEPTDKQVGETVFIEKTKISFKEILSKFKILLLKLLYNTKSFLSNKAKLKKLAVNSIFALVISAILLSSISVWAYFSLSNKNTALTESLRSKWSFSEAIDNNGKYTAFGPLNAINADIDAWLQIGEGLIDLPVCTTPNNSYYKRHNYNKKFSPYGALFFDEKTKINTENEYDNIVIYGNSPKDNSMFAPLNNYKSLNFLKENHIINLTTEFSQKTYRIFAVIIIDSTEKDPEFNLKQNKFSDVTDAEKWISEVRIRSLYKVSTVIPNNCDFITLVTDIDEFKNAQLAVIGFEVSEEDENYASLISVNTAPYYPAIWYKVHKSQNPYADGKPMADFIPEIPSDEPIIIVPNPEDTTSKEPEPDSSVSDTSSNSTSSGTTNSTPSSTPSGTTSSTPSNTASSDTQSDLNSDNTSNTESDTTSDTTSDNLDSSNASDSTVTD